MEKESHSSNFLYQKLYRNFLKNYQLVTSTTLLILALSFESIRKHHVQIIVASIRRILLCDRAIFR